MVFGIGKNFSARAKGTPGLAGHGLAEACAVACLAIYPASVDVGDVCCQPTIAGGPEMDWGKEA